MPARTVADFQRVQCAELDGFVDFHDRTDCSPTLHHHPPQCRSLYLARQLLRLVHLGEKKHQIMIFMIKFRSFNLNHFDFYV